jgi:hypothetical protein
MPKIPYEKPPTGDFAAYCGIDLAMIYSGLLMVDSSCRVSYEEAPQHTNPSLWTDVILRLRREATLLGASDEGGGLTILVEDVYPAVAMTSSYKPVVRLQGVLMATLHSIIPAANLSWSTPAAWQREMGYTPYPDGHPRNANGKKSRPYSTKLWAKEECARLTYEPPQWARGSKALEDMRDAALITTYLYAVTTGRRPATLPRLARAA